MEDKIKELSNILVNYSIRVQKNEKVLINSYTNNSIPLIKELIKDIYKVGGIPFVRFQDNQINSLLLKGTIQERMEQIKIHTEEDNRNYDSFIQIRFNENEFEDKLINPSIKKELAKTVMEPNEIRINERKWVLLNYPSIIDAFKANIPTEDFFKFAFDAMTFDYKKLSKDLEPLKKLMEKTDKVKIIGPNTDISFSIKNIPAIPCCGECNIPDGEIYTAPVKDSVNGRITYNTASPYNGNVFRNVSLNFKDGKIIEATCDDDNKALNEIFDTDEGSRYIGEFAIGVNKLIEYPIGDILFDEKIKGSIHFTPGKCYENAQNGNNSAIHWDLVLIQREDFGGGEIYFDDLLIRKDGLFVIDELKHLN
ncbi:MAG: aminopeptidase [Bacilli bacterium]